MPRKSNWYPQIWGRMRVQRQKKWSDVGKNETLGKRWWNWDPKKKFALFFFFFVLSLFSSPTTSTNCCTQRNLLPSIWREREDWCIYIVYDLRWVEHTKADQSLKIDSKDTLWDSLSNLFVCRIQFVALV